MSKAVLISIRPKWCELIARGEKTLEVRKNKPKLETPFKCYIYCTLPPRSELFGHGCIREYANELIRLQSGEIVYSYGMQLCCDPENRPYTKDNFLCQKVIGEFVCDECSLLAKAHYGYIEQKGCIPKKALKEYMGIEDGRELEYTDGCYGWHISDLVIYDKPKALSEFRSYDCSVVWRDGYPIPTHEIKRAPQSWCYVMEGKNNEES